MAANDKVICIGEDMTKKGGCWSYFANPKYHLTKEFGEDRMLDMPIAESAYSAFAVGAAIAGYHPVVEFMFSDFSTLGIEAIGNMAAKQHYLSGKRFSCPATFLLPQGGGGRSGAHHSQSVEAWYANIPGLKLVAPTSAADVRAYLRASIEDPDPVVFFYQRALFGISGEVPETLDELPSLAHAGKVLKVGADLTVVGYHRELLYAQEVAEQVEKETGKTIEIIDPVVLSPFDKELLVKSVRKTGRLLVVHQAPTHGGFGNQIISYAMEEAATDMKANPLLVGSKNCVIPFGMAEEFIYPSKDEIREGMLKVLNG